MRNWFCSVRVQLQNVQQTVDTVKGNIADAASALIAPAEFDQILFGRIQEKVFVNADYGVVLRLP
jgi:hypothetical protein